MRLSNHNESSIRPPGPIKLTIIAPVKVLLVEDDLKLARFLRRLLAEEGYTVDLCTGGEDCLAQAGSGPVLVDVILAEPVGSCTDLVATVVQPIKDLYGGQLEVAPYAVLFKPSHGLKILRNEKAGGFSPKAAYIFRKQLEEADAILVNRNFDLWLVDPDDGAATRVTRGHTGAAPHGPTRCCCGRVGGPIGRGSGSSHSGRGGRLGSGAAGPGRVWDGDGSTPRQACSGRWSG